jgi:hypothetical protein
VVAACSDPRTAPPDVDLFEGQVKLVSPSNGSRFAQNDPSIGCTAHPFRGYGFRLAFDWEDVRGAHGYAIYLEHVGSTYPAIDHHVTESRYAATWCNAFVADVNLDNWIWRVAAIRAGAAATVPDTLWSEERTYGFQPCRHPDGAPCTAPPEPVP